MDYQEWSPGVMDYLEWSPEVMGYLEWSPEVELLGNAADERPGCVELDEVEAVPALVHHLLCQYS
jgi:hypothetical protein